MDARMRPRQHVRNRFVLIGDIALIIISVLGSFALRLDVGELPFYFPAAALMCVVALGLRFPSFSSSVCIADYGSTPARANCG
jgi:hypothetical protein